MKFLTHSIVYVFGILTLYGAQSFLDFDAINKSNQNGSRLILFRVATEIEKFKVACSRLPTEEEGLSSLTSGQEYCGFTTSLPKKAIFDAWGNPIVYKINSEGSYSLFSLGSDGKPGGSGINEDIIIPDIFLETL